MLCPILGRNLTLDADTRTLRLSDLTFFGNSLIGSDGNFDLSEVSALISMVDQLWFSNSLLKLVDQKYGPLKVKLDVPRFLLKDVRKPPAGVVYQVKRKFTLAINRPLLYKLFKKGHETMINSGYHVGGVVRRSLVDCLIHVLCHELVHLVIQVCDHKDKRKPHPMVFSEMSRAFFGHTVEKHGLVPGLLHEDDFLSIRAQARPGKRVMMFVHGDWVSAIVVQAGRLYARVLDDHGRTVRVHIGLIKVVPN